MTKKDNIMFDKIDELAEEHPFLRTELGQYAFQLGFDEGFKAFIDEACEWIKENYINECGSISVGNAYITFYQDHAIEKFKKVMLKNNA